MVRILKKLLGIDSIEERLGKLENSQTPVISDKPLKLSDNVLDEWINGKEENDE